MTEARNSAADPPRPDAQRHQRMIENLPHAVWTTTADGSTDFLNSRGTEALGVAAGAIYGWGWLSLVHPDDVERCRRAWETCVRDGSLYRNEYRLRHADGSYHWYAARAVPLRAADGRVEHWIGSWTDIDDWKRAEEGMARASQILTSVRDSIIVTDMNGVVSFWNEGATQLFGWEAGEMLGRPMMERFPLDARPGIADLMRRVAGGEVWMEEFEDYCKDGSRVWISARVGLIRDAQGRPTGMLGIARDVTDRRLAEAELRMRDRAIQAVTQGILITDPNAPDNPIVFASPGFRAMTGYSPAEVIGRNCRFLQGPGTDPQSVAQIRAAVATGQACRVELLNYRSDGKQFWNELSISPVRDERGRLSHFVGVQTDVTERRMLEDQFRQAQKMEAVGKLAGGVAHDFNNLLTVIAGYSEIILQGLAPEDPTRGMIEQIRMAGERAAGLTSQLLAFSRRQVLAPIVLDINRLTAQLEKMLTRLTGADVEFVISSAPDLWKVRADPGQIEQIIMNLAVNARDAMPQGGKLTIETANVVLDESYARRHVGARPGEYVLLAMTDTGIGMSPETRSRIFEPFFTTKGPGQGTGLGLATVWGIVEQSMGRIEVYSEPGVGTSFKIFLPRTTDEATDGRAVAELADLQRGTETVLLAEDDDALRALSKLVLLSNGYTVIEARNGVEALALAEKHPARIDLLLTDVVMPNLGGRHLAERLMQQRPDLKVLYMSGYTDDAVIRHGILETTAAFLQKPFSPLRLARKIREVLDA